MTPELWATEVKPLAEFFLFLGLIVSWAIGACIGRWL